MAIISGSLPAVAFPTFPVRPFSVEEYCRLAETGVLAEDERVELLEGWITPMMTRGSEHDSVVHALHDAIARALPDGWAARNQGAVTTSDSVPEPDIGVLRGQALDYFRKLPGIGDIVCAMEVADSSLKRDREKARIYAHAAIPVYWIVNLVDYRVEVYNEPGTEKGEYQKAACYEKAARVPLVIAGDVVAEIPVDDFLP